MSANRYIRFVELSSGLIKDSRIPLFSSKFSKKTYTQHQLLILLLLKEYLVETVFSVLKRKFGESMKARKFQSQIKELKIKLILYNISKIILPIFIRNYR